MTNRTPTPWTQKGNKVQAGPYPREFIGIGCSGKVEAPRIITTYKVNFYVREEADAAFIVRCVNSHEELLRLAKESLSQFKFYDGRATIKNHDKQLIEDLIEAIAKAEGKKL